MKKFTSFIVGLLVLGVLLVSMVTYRVRYNEMVIVTTFGRADESSVRNADGQGAGLYWKLPWPAQEVARTFDARVQILESRIEQIQTADAQTLIASAFVSWRVSDPLAFYRTLNNFQQAQEQIRDRLRTILPTMINQYAFEDLHNIDPRRVKFPELEQRMREAMQSDLAARNYGVTIESVQIKRTMLPDTVSEKVFERMRANRARLAQRARSEGEAAAETIRSNARSAEQRILAFAERRAQTIRSEGDAAAAEQYKIFSQDEQFASFLRKLEAYRAILGNNTSFFFDAIDGPFDLFAPPPTPNRREAQTPDNDPAALLFRNPQADQ